MPGEIYIPPEVLQSIRDHVTSAVRRAESGYASAQEEEDSVTGALGERLRTEDAKLVDVRQGDPPGTWRWKISYAKLRSKPKGSPESLVGADGILELEIGGPEGSQRKAALFQAKNSPRNDRRLAEQCAKMSNWREAAFVIRYSSDGYSAYSIDDCLAAGGSIAQVQDGEPLASWISDTFIRCLVGHPWLHYDVDQQRLYWVPVGSEDNYGDSRWVWVNFRPKHRISISVTPPNWRLAGSTQVPRELIQERRLSYTPRDLLGLRGDFTRKDLKRRVRELRRAYHSDRNNHLKAAAKKLLDARFAEITRAAELLESEAVPEVHSRKRRQKREAHMLAESSSEPLEKPEPKRERVRGTRRRPETS